MIADFDDFCTWMYVIISEAFAPIAHQVARPGPAPECSDAELLTMAIVGECLGWDHETVLISQWAQHRDLFPTQPDRTRFNRRRRALGQACNLLRRAVLAVLDVAQDRQCAIESLPIPVVQFYWVPQASSDWRSHDAAFGRSCSKKQTFFGDKLHLLVTLGGVIRDFELAPANRTDLQVGVELLAGHRHLDVWGDKASISAPVAAELARTRDILLHTLPRANQPGQPSPAVRRRFNGAREMIETVNSQLTQQLHVEANHAHTCIGLMARLYTKLTAHTLCIYFNRLLGLPAWLPIKSLAFPI
jgi:Transposase DDE domain